jgi:Protein of unknown function (DUF3263)
MSLTVRDTMTLDFEAKRCKYAGAKDKAILDTFGETSTRYYQRLGDLLDRRGVAYSPTVVRRLQRLRDARRRARRAA